jgi:hypothetical protein
MVRQYGLATLVQPGFLVVECVGKDRVDIALLLQVVQDLIDAFIDPTERLDLQGDEVLPILYATFVDGRCNCRLRLWVRRPSEERRTCGTKTEEISAIEERRHVEASRGWVVVIRENKRTRHILS